LDSFFVKIPEVAQITLLLFLHGKSYGNNLMKKWISLHFGQLLHKRIWCRVARWFVFKPKIPIWVNFGGSCNGSCW
jgi:hypothetical protein